VSVRQDAFYGLALVFEFGIALGEFQQHRDDVLAVSVPVVRARASGVDRCRIGSVIAELDFDLVRVGLRALHDGGHGLVEAVDALDTILVAVGDRTIEHLARAEVTNLVGGEGHM